MKTVLILLSLTFGLVAQETTLTIKELTKAELEEIDRAKAARDAALFEYQQKLQKIEERYGQTPTALNGYAFTTLTCGPRVTTSVSIEGKYALIRTTTDEDACKLFWSNVQTTWSERSRDK